VKIRCTNK